jgi:hypothetical protein
MRVSGLVEPVKALRHEERVQVKIACVSDGRMSHSMRFGTAPTLGQKKAEPFD